MEHACPDWRRVEGAGAEIEPSLAFRIFRDLGRRVQVVISPVVPSVSLAREWGEGAVLRGVAAPSFVSGGLVFVAAGIVETQPRTQDGVIAGPGRGPLSRIPTLA